MKRNYFYFLVFISLSSYAQFNYQRTWATFFGGNTCSGKVTIDNQGFIYIIGGVGGNESNFNYYSNFTTAGSYQPNVNFTINNDRIDGFITKFSPTGTVIWSTYLGSNESDASRDAFFDSENNLYIVGVINKNATNVPFITIQPDFSFQDDIFNYASKYYLVKFNSAGQLLWGKYTKGSITDIKFDSNDNMYITGTTVYDTGIATVGAFQENFMGNAANYKGVPYLAKYNSSGIKLWGSYYGNSLNGYNSLDPKITLDENNNIYIASKISTIASEFYATTGCFQTFSDHPNWNKGSFLSKFDTNGTRIWSTYVGLSELPLPGATVDSEQKFTDISTIKYYNNYIYLAGSTSVSTNISTSGSYQQQLNVIDANTIDNDAFIMKFDINGNRIWGTYYGGFGGESRLNLEVFNNKVFIAGATTSNNIMASENSFQTTLTSNRSEYNSNISKKDGFIAQFSTTGIRNWGSYYGGDGTADYCNIVSIANDTFYVGGYTNSATNIATAGSYQPERNVGTATFTTGLQNCFLARFDVNPLSTTTNEFNTFILVPNPSNGNFSITGTLKNNYNEILISITDSQGRTVFSKNSLDTTNFNEEIKLQNQLSKGIYFVNLTSQSKSLKTFKIVIN